MTGTNVHTMQDVVGMAQAKGMTLPGRAWDARIDAALALFIGAAIVGMLAFSGIIGSAAGAPGHAAYVLLALSVVFFTWAGLRAVVRARSLRRA